MDTCKDDEDTNYVFVMDNFFTSPKTISEEALPGKGVACIGTAQKQKGWLPKPIDDVDDKSFNTLYLYDNPNGFRIF